MPDAMLHPIYSHGGPVPLAQNVWQVTGSLKIPVPRNMAIVRGAEGELVLYSVIAMNAGGMAELEALGECRQGRSKVAHRLGGQVAAREGNHVATPGRVRSEYAVEAHQRVTRRWDQGAESREKLSRGHHAMRLVAARVLDSIGDAPVREHTEALEAERGRAQ